MMGEEVLFIRTSTNHVVLMLDGLTTIDWDTLSHAYGDADDVPGVLQSLLSTDVSECERSISELYGSIWHQGTVYAATAKAVPFLYELLTSPGVLCKSNIAHLLACIADGQGYLEVHAVGNVGESTWREILGKKGKSLEDELAREAAVIDSVRRAVSPGLPYLVPFLLESEPEIRRAVAAALGRYPEHSANSLPALKAAAASETDEEVCEALQQSLADLNIGNRS